MATYLWFSASSFGVFGFVDFLFHVVVMTTCVTLHLFFLSFPYRSSFTFDWLITPCSCFLLTLRWFFCVFPGSCVQTRRFLFCCLSFDSLWFYGLLWILCFCIWTMGFHYTVARFWFLCACFHVCVWVAFCVTLRISSSSPPSMGSRLGRVWLFFGWVYTWYKGKQCVLPVLNGHARCQGKEPTITEKSVRSCCVENNK